MTLQIRDPELAALAAQAQRLGAEAFLAEAIERTFAGRIAVVSSFGTEAAALLHLVSRIDRAVPVIFLDTGKLFAETLEYRNRLIERLGLTDVRSVRPSAEEIARHDPAGTLWQGEPDQCCRLRKVEPLSLALSGFAAWISGRKRFHGGARSELPLVEHSDGRFKLNPLAHWPAAKVRDYFVRHALPPHPLASEGYSSVGCTHCTTPSRAGEGVREGRWRGSGKTECGIHFELGGPVRAATRKRHETQANDAQKTRALNGD